MVPSNVVNGLSVGVRGGGFECFVCCVIGCVRFWCPALSLLLAASYLVAVVLVVVIDVALALAAVIILVIIPSFSGSDGGLSRRLFRPFFLF